MYMQNRHRLKDIENKQVVIKGEGEGKGQDRVMVLRDINYYV